MSTIGEHRTLPELISGLSHDVSSLFRKEVQLAKAEASEKIGKAMGGVVSLLAGAVLALGALGVLLTAAVTGVAALLMRMGMTEGSASFLGALIVGGVVALIAYVMIKRGTETLKAENLWLDRTAHSVTRDAAVIKEKVNG